MSNPLKDISGQRFGLLTVLDRAPARLGITAAVWRCRCDCGAIAIRTGGGLRIGQSLSCGCLKKLKLVTRNKAGDRGITTNPLYEVWRGMIKRCTDPTSSSYKHYGAKGIEVCESWQQSFLNFFSDMGERPVGYTLERRDSRGNYEPSNCRWASRKEQGENRCNVLLIKVGDKQLDIPDACRYFGTNSGTAHGRIRRGWDPLRAVSEQPRATIRR